MKEGIVQIFYGEGHGKTNAAIGNALHFASLGRSAIVIQFLKGRNEDNIRFFKRFEPEVKYFNFSKSKEDFSELAPERQEEACMNQKNGFHYARKVITTGACDVLVLDEILGLEDLGIAAYDEFRAMLAQRPEDMTVICTGRVLDGRFRELADEIYHIEPEK